MQLYATSYRYLRLALMSGTHDVTLSRANSLIIATKIHGARAVQIRDAGQTAPYDGRGNRGDSLSIIVIQNFARSVEKQ